VFSPINRESMSIKLPNEMSKINKEGMKEHFIVKFTIFYESNELNKIFTWDFVLENFFERS